MCSMPITIMLNKYWYYSRANTGSVYLISILLSTEGTLKLLWIIKIIIGQIGIDKHGL